MDNNEQNEIRKLIHDLRSPIAVINGFLDAMKELPMDDKLKEYYEAAVRSGEKVEAKIMLSGRDENS